MEQLTALADTTGYNSVREVLAGLLAEEGDIDQLASRTVRDDEWAAAALRRLAPGHALQPDGTPTAQM